jgi:hypothetical protein
MIRALIRATGHDEGDYQEGGHGLVKHKQNQQLGTHMGTTHLDPKSKQGMLRLAHQKLYSYSFRPPTGSNDWNFSKLFSSIDHATAIARPRIANPMTGGGRHLCPQRPLLVHIKFCCREHDGHLTETCQSRPPSRSSRFDAPAYTSVL